MQDTLSQCCCHVLLDKGNNPDGITLGEALRHFNEIHNLNILRVCIGVVSPLYLMEQVRKPWTGQLRDRCFKVLALYPAAIPPGVR